MVAMLGRIAFTDALRHSVHERVDLIRANPRIVDHWSRGSLAWPVLQDPR